MPQRYKYPRTPEDLRSLSLEELEHRYGRLLHRYAGWNVPGMQRDDLMQELRITLMKCQKGFSFGNASGAKFTTYLTSALKHRVWNLGLREGRRTHLWDTMPDDDGDEMSQDRLAGLEDPWARLALARVDDTICLENLSPGALELVHRVMVEGNYRVPQRLRGAATEILGALDHV